MPAGGTAVGFAYFVAAKFLGYTAFCHWVIEPRILENIPNPNRGSTLFPVEVSHPRIPSAFEAGAARTVIGIAAGALAGLSFFSGMSGFEKHGDVMTWIFFALLVPIRVGEWWFLLWWMYRPFLISSGTRGRLITFGILVSFALDAIGVLAAFVLPGGIWIC